MWLALASRLRDGYANRDLTSLPAQILNFLRKFCVDTRTGDFVASSRGPGEPSGTAGPTRSSTQKCRAGRPIGRESRRSLDVSAEASRRVCGKPRRRVSSRSNRAGPIPKHHVGSAGNHVGSAKKTTSGLRPDARPSPRFNGQRHAALGANFQAGVDGVPDVRHGFVFGRALADAAGDGRAHGDPRPIIHPDRDAPRISWLEPEGSCPGRPNSGWPTRLQFTRWKGTDNRLGPSQQVRRTRHAQGATNGDTPESLPSLMGSCSML